MYDERIEHNIRDRMNYMQDGKPRRWVALGDCTATDGHYYIYMCSMISLRAVCLLLVNDLVCLV